MKHLLTLADLTKEELYEPDTICKIMSHLPFVFKNSARKRICKAGFLTSVCSSLWLSATVFCI